MSTTRNFKEAYNTASSFSMPPASPSQSYTPSSAHQYNPLDHNNTTWEATLASTSESPNDPQSLPPRMRLKEKKKPFGEFRIIREPVPIRDRTTELRPIPSPPWAKDSFSLDSSHCLHDDTRGNETSHVRPSFPSNATAGPSLRYQESCPHSRTSSKSSVECSTTSGFQALSISSPYAWTASNRSPPPPPHSTSTLNTPFLSTSTSTGSLAAVNHYPASLHQTDDASSDAGPSHGITYQFRPHRIVKSRSRTAQTIVTHSRPESEYALPMPDEDDEEEGEGEGETTTTILKQLQHTGMDTNTFPQPARPSRKQKRYGCDVCGQIFTRSGDVRRHKESRHDNSEGCRCPFCGRVLTRQDALQRHWDKYCRMKSKRHLDKQASEAQNRSMSSMPAPVYAPGAPAQTMGIGIGPDQMKFRYLNIFG